MPTRLPEKPRARSIHVHERDVLDDREAHGAHLDAQHRIADARRRHRDGKQHHSIDTFDWLALWALSLGFSAMFRKSVV